MHAPMTPPVACLAAALVAAPVAGLAQTDPARSMGTDALALFARVCLAAYARGEAPQAVASQELAGERPVPQERLRTAGSAREIAGWRVQGRHTLMLLEPGAQCAVYTAGVDPAGFLEDTRRLMLQPDSLPGWIRRGEPQESSSPRPFGTLTFLRSHHTRLLPLPDAPPTRGPVPLPSVSILASAAQRTDGQPHTAVISVGTEGR